MSPTARAAQLRRRAQHLRTLASEMESTPALSLGQHAGEETWCGSRPELCRSALKANHQRLHASADSLREQAYLFVRHANEIEIEVRRALAIGG
ncbi:MAG: hypothetical protein KUG57_11730 [Ilumatobacteraceae bacterium]|nr:hypothetical protein [Ilumatobacteraceae bacterium]